MILNIKSEKGFSFLEIIICLSLLLILSTLVFVSFNNLSDRQSFDKQIDLIKSTINQTRMDAINAKNSDSNTVQFLSDSIIYQDKVISLQNNISLMSYTTSTTTISFDKVSGFPNATGTLIYKLQKGDDVIATSSIIINNLGIIE